MKQRISPTLLKRKAKQLKKEQGLKHQEALDIISKKFGYSSYQEYEKNLDKHKCKVTLSSIEKEANIKNKEILAQRYIKQPSSTYESIYEMILKFKEPEIFTRLCYSAGYNKLFKKFITQDINDNDTDFEVPDFFKIVDLNITFLEFEIWDDKVSVDGNLKLKASFMKEVYDTPDCKDSFFDDRFSDCYAHILIPPKENEEVDILDISLSNWY